MSDLVAFLRDRLADDERLARAVPVGRGGSVGGTSLEGTDHYGRWDPARVLAEVQAKRAILDAYPIQRSLRDLPWEVIDLMGRIIHSSDGTVEWAEEWRRRAEVQSAEEFLEQVRSQYGVDVTPDVLKHLAAVYADHPEYDQRWSLPERTTE